MYKPHHIFGMSNKNMQKRFGISKKELFDNYASKLFSDASKREDRGESHVL